MEIRKWTISKGNNYYVVNVADDINIIIGKKYKTGSFNKMKVGDVYWIDGYRIECKDREDLTDLSNLWR